MFTYLKQKSLLVNLLIVFFLVAIIIVLFFGSLDFLTKHGEYEKVPDVTGKSLEKARKILEDKGFEVEIQDSIYIDSLPKLSIVKQIPEPNATVKVNRTIYLTLNRSQPPVVEMPNLVGFTLRNAQMYLENLGLHLGDTSFRPDIAKNAVLEQLYKGEDIKAGTKVFMGSTIDFVLGNGIGEEDMLVPNLIGKKYNEVQSLLKQLHINYTSAIDQDVTDTANAFVYRQSPTKYAPAPNGEKRFNKIKEGQNIDIYLSVKQMQSDSTVTEFQ